MDDYNNTEMEFVEDGSKKKGLLVGAGLVGAGAAIGLGGRWMVRKIKDIRADRKDKKRYKAEAERTRDEIG